MSDKPIPTQQQLNIAMFACTVNLFDAVTYAALSIASSEQANEAMKTHMQSVQKAMEETKEQLKETLELLKRAEP